jgi:5-methylcytosine-specific restriction endonuclease McrA
MSLPKYTNEQLIEAVKVSYSYRAVLVKLGILPDGGGSLSNIKKKIQKLKLDTSHFLGQAVGRLKPREQRKKRISNSQLLRNKLLKTRINRCESCGLDQWLHKPIPLEVHHIDGNRRNNKETNLKLLCPNCHRFTDNWGNRLMG